VLFANPEEFLRYLKNEGVRFVDVRFCDLLGVMQHFTIPVESFDDSIFSDGVAFDGSSIRGFQQIHESDMLLLPDHTTAFVDPFRVEKTLALNFFIHDPFTREAYSRDPRNIAKKAETYLAASGIADTAYFGPEAEFYVFDSLRHETSAHQAYYYIDSVEGWWNTGRDEDGGNRGYKTGYKAGYFPVPPVDHYADLRDQMVSNMLKVGLTVERAHHEVGTAGQAEINFKFSTLLHCADNLQLYKYIVKNTAWAAGKSATFMPKPLFGDNGSGMHTHQSLWKAGKPLFYDAKGYAGTSQLCRWYIGGLLKHGRALMAFCAPTTNSYKRLVPGYEAPVNLVYSARNRSAAARIPMYTEAPAAKRIEFRPPDPSSNPYLAFSAMLMAGLDGIENKIDPGNPLDKNTYELSEREARRIPTVPGSLDEALKALEADHKFLLKGGVFTQDVIDVWLEYKREAEIDPIRLRPHPWEFQLYFDV
jgi:glutamine synthetase